MIDRPDLLLSQEFTSSDNNTGMTRMSHTTEPIVLNSTVRSVLLSQERAREI
jgi:hypothetical protein